MRNRASISSLALFLSVALLACAGDGEPAGDAGTEDAGTEDAGTEDAGTEDAGTEDAGTEDAGMEDAGTIIPLVMEAEGRTWHVEPLSYPGLQDRRVDVFLPEGYDSDPSARFPVLYMHDGQNLFDPAQAAFGVAWEVDETLDALTAQGHVPPHIVVGIHNTAERIDDYTPDVDPSYGGGKGDLYADFLAEVLKPAIDHHFRTQPGRESTAIMGSSLGGIISLHIFMRHPLVFGRVGAVSPSLWWNDRSPVFRFEAYDGPMPHRLWLDMGTGEDSDALMGPYLVENLRQVRSRAESQGMVYGDDLACLEDPKAEHNEAAWANRLDSILTFLLGDEKALDLPVTKVDLFLFRPQLILDSPFVVTTLAVEALHDDRLRLTWPNREVGLESSEPSVASLASDGALSALSAGETEISAGMANLHAARSLRVSEQSAVRVELWAFLPAGSPAGETIYVTGDRPDLGPWDPAAQALDCEGQLCHGSLIMPWDTSFAFKFTRGSWGTVEKYADCTERPDREVAASGLDLEFVSWIDAWADLCP
ncbi:MAG: hypothetical protein JRF33_13600 [Deltaproteobacteria bacterium]|nr:hypothetical protein [Deltaproteobacteria bacterium]